MINHLYLAIEDALTTKLGADTEVDYFSGQYLDDESLKLPAVYLEFAPLQFDQHLELAQTANVTFTLHIVTEALEIGQRRWSQTTMADHWQIVHDCYLALQGCNVVVFNAPVLENIKRLQLLSDHESGSHLVTRMVFGGTAYDFSAMRQSDEETLTDLAIEPVYKPMNLTF
jgi:hypothetical protein